MTTSKQPPALQTKGLQVEIKDADKGLIRCVFATTGVKDHDGDWTLPGAFGVQSVALSAYGHSWRGGTPPIGRGTIKEVGPEAVGEFQVFMDVPSAREQFIIIREMGELQEWSYGFRVLETGELTQELRQIGVYQVIKKVKVWEVSPVLIGAGLGTATLSAKDAKEPPAEAPAAKAAPTLVHKVHCSHCGYALGESAEPMVPVGKAANAAEVELKMPPPRDVRICKSCRHHIVFIPHRLLRTAS